MQISVNGQSREVLSPMTLAGLLDSLGVNSRAVVVERNLRIVDRTLLEQEGIEEGDRIEIIRLVGGG